MRWSKRLPAFCVPPSNKCHSRDGFENNLPRLFADATQLNQVIMNLCVNASHAMKNGGKLTMSVRATTADAPTVRSAASNCSAGILNYVLPIPATAWIRSPCDGSSTRSSPPNRLAKAPDWDSPSRTYHRASWRTHLRPIRGRSGNRLPHLPSCSQRIRQSSKCVCQFRRYDGTPIPFSR